MQQQQVVTAPQATSTADDSMLRRSWRQFKRHRLAVLGGVVVLLIIGLAILAPVVAPYDPYVQNLDMRLKQPGGPHLLGTDSFGRDLFSRILWGGRVSLSIALLSIALSILIGTVLGAISGYMGGAWDWGIMRLTDIFLAIPSLFIILIVVALIGPSFTLTVLMIAFAYWPSTARIVRAEFLSLRKRDFVEAAVALGVSTPRIMIRHVLPNAMAPIIVQATLQVARAIVLESGLSYLGLGAQPPIASWGNILAEGHGHLRMAPWIATFSGIAIWLTTLSFNFLGDGIRDALDPRLKL